MRWSCITVCRVFVGGRAVLMQGSMVGALPARSHAHPSTRSSPSRLQANPTSYPRTVPTAYPHTTIRPWPHGGSAQLPSANPVRTPTPLILYLFS